MNIIGNDDIESFKTTPKFLPNRFRIKKRVIKEKETLKICQNSLEITKKKGIHHSTDDSENEGIL